MPFWKSKESSLLAYIQRIFTDKKEGRKVKELSEKEKEVMKKAKAKYKLGARSLERVIERVYGIHTTAYTNSRSKKVLQGKNQGRREEGGHT